jgi:hypothetical protein
MIMMNELEENIKYNSLESILNAIEKKLNNGNSLQYSNDELRNNEEVVFKSVEQHCPSLKYGSEELKNDKDFILKCLKINGGLLTFASKELKNDKEVVFEAVKQNVDSLGCADYELRNDKSFIKKCIKINRNSLEFASTELKEDSNFILECVEIDEYLSKHIKKIDKRNKSFFIKIYDYIFIITVGLFIYHFSS